MKEMIFCWGTITNYEYLLPSGWSIGSNVSNGNNWIAGTQNVTITSVNLMVLMDK